MSIHAEDLIVHEWGTFTSLMGSDGSRQEGMHHEEATLPDFVYGFKRPQSEPKIAETSQCTHVKLPCPYLDTLSRHNNSAEITPENPIGAGITQKMETPVIYFYGDVGQKVTVEIKFPQGIISQYYPKATSYAPRYNEAKTLGPSNFSFDVQLLQKSDTVNLPLTMPNSIWNPSRVVNANTIFVDREYEKFIFYRGVGDFDAKLVVKNDGKKATLINHSSAPIQQAFILNFDGSKGAIKPIGSIRKKKEVVIPATKMMLPLEVYISSAKDLIANALIAEGLFKDEAEALVNTWEKSYFKTPGVRILIWCRGWKLTGFFH